MTQFQDNILFIPSSLSVIVMSAVLLSPILASQMSLPNGKLSLTKNVSSGSYVLSSTRRTVQFLTCVCENKNEINK